MESPIQYLIDNGFVDTFDNDEYSFVFDGQVGSLDYALVKSEALQYVLDSAVWNLNADEPDLIDYNLNFGRDPSLFDASIPERFSDHDIKLLAFNFEVPTMSPSLTPSVQPSITSSTTPSIAPSDGPTQSPTSLMKPWLIGPCVLEESENSIRVSNVVGFKGAMNSLSVKLFDFDCENEKDLVNSTNAVTIFDITQPDPDPAILDPLIYNVNISQTNIASDTGGFVSITGSSNNTGEVKFCTRVSSLYHTTEIAFRECNFVVEYNLTAGFNLSSIDIFERETETFETTIASDYVINVCQCEDFVCVAPTAIQQDDMLTICLEPTQESSTDVVTVQIFNFNLKLSAGVPFEPDYVEYNPVWFSTDGWSSDALTLVTEQLTSGGQVIMVRTPIIAQFYIQSHDTVQVDGSAFLQFPAAKATSSPSLSVFGTIIGIEPPVLEGCLMTLLKKILKYF